MMESANFEQTLLMSLCGSDAWELHQALPLKGS
jgi:hypothetical protein